MGCLANYVVYSYFILLLNTMKSFIFWTALDVIANEVKQSRAYKEGDCHVLRTRNDTSCQFLAL